MKIQIFANYGVLAHEYQVIYTDSAPHCNACTSECITVEIPDEYETYRNAFDELVIRFHASESPWLLSEALITTKDNKPGLRWYQNDILFSRALTICEEE